MLNTGKKSVRAALREEGGGIEMLRNNAELKHYEGRTWGDDGDVWQVSASSLRVIGQQHIA